MDIEISRKDGEENIKIFKPSTQEELESFNLVNGDKCEITVLDFCPFTLTFDVYTTIAYIVNEVEIQGSNYKLCFCFVDAYGQDSYSSFEDTKIIKKLINERR